MSERKANALVLAGLLAADIRYLYTAFSARRYRMVLVGPFEFPKILGIVFGVAILVILAQTLLQKGNSREIMPKNIGLIAITLATTFMLLLLWQEFGHFYLWGFLYLLALLFCYRLEGGRFSRKNVSFNLLLASCTTAAAYVAFDMLMKIRL